MGEALKTGRERAETEGANRRKPPQKNRADSDSLIGVFLLDELWFTKQVREKNDRRELVVEEPAPKFRLTRPAARPLRRFDL